MTEQQKPKPKSSDTYLSPSQPYTGDGRRSRSLYDKVRVIFKPGASK